MPRTVAIRAFNLRILGEQVVSVEHSVATVTGERRSVTVRLHVMTVKAELVVDERGDLTLLEPGSVIDVERVGARLCRYHEGPPGDVLKQRWCWSLAIKGSWCSRHISSPLAMYERCVAGNDYTACKSVDALWPRERYVIYLLDYGQGVKVGVTREWRFYTRIFEQPHVAAVRLYTVNSATAARRLEKSLARMRGVTEGIGIPRHARMTRALLSTLSVEDEARRLAYTLARLGFEGVFDAYRILHEDCPTQPLVSTTLPLQSGVNRYVCSWGGAIVLEANGRLYSVSRDELFHRILYLAR